VWVEDESNPINTFVTCLVRFKIRFELCESDHILMLPHCYCFFVIVGIDVGTGTGGGGGASKNDWRVAEVERVWRLSSWASI